MIQIIEPAITANDCKVTEFHIKDFWSSMTHFIGFIMSFCGSLFLMQRAYSTNHSIAIISMGIFSLSLMLLYAASTTYHAFDLDCRRNQILKKIDHMMISVLIAGSYTPICLLALPVPSGRILLAVIWGLAIAGILIKAFWIYCPKWVSSVLYIGMGWACIFVLPMLYHSLTSFGFAWILTGGILYTVGGIIYGLKLSVFNKKHANFGSHEIFHLFVMGGSICHFILMYSEVVFM